MEILNANAMHGVHLKAAVFDFDGTISTLRQGWEEVMRPLMCEMIDPSSSKSETEKLVDQYIDESTGIQTIYQMQWLRERIVEFGENPEIHDIWWYKDEYNRRLMEQVQARLAALEAAELAPADFMIKGSGEFIRRLVDNDIDLFVASGTDDADVVKEVKALGLKNYFTGIAGAPYRRADCSKEAVIKNLLENKKLEGQSLLVVGDGKVEIRLGKEAGALTLGAATDEVMRSGINPVKRHRLVAAGADAIVGDFSESDEIFKWLNIK